MIPETNILLPKGGRRYTSVRKHACSRNSPGQWWLFQKTIRRVKDTNTWMERHTNALSPIELGKLYATFKMSTYEVYQIVMLFNYKQIFAPLFKMEGEFHLGMYILPPQIFLSF